jgi:hypothetical protein
MSKPKETRVHLVDGTWKAVALYPGGTAVAFDCPERGAAEMVAEAMKGVDFEAVTVGYPREVDAWIQSGAR